MATAVQVESLWNGLTDNNGQPLAAGKVYTYNAGTTTPVSLFTSSDKSSSATNPLILDGYGKAQVWADGRYKFVVKTSADVTLYTLDNLLYGFDDTTVLYGGSSTGSANAQIVSVPATVTSYANGQTVSFVAGYTNTGATTLQFNSLSAVNLVKGPTPSSLQAGDLIAGQLYTATYHGGNFRLQDYPSVADVQRSRYETLSNVGGTNTIVGDLTPALTSYESGLQVRFKAANSSTGAATLNVNGLGAKAVQYNNAALVGGEIAQNVWHQAVYDGTQFQLLNPINVSSPTWGGTTGGTSTAYTITPAPAITAYAAGQRFTFNAHAANGATPTLAVNGLAAKNIFDATTLTAIGANRILASKAYDVLYDGTQFRLLNDAGEVQNGDYIWLGTTGGTATAQTASASPAITAYKTGQKFRMKIGAGLGSTGSTNTAHTININSLGTKNIVNQSGTNPTIGTWVAGALMECIYDGTNFVITNDPGGWLTYTPTVTASGSMTVSSLVINEAKYRKTGTSVNLWLHLTMTLGGTASNTLFATLPINTVAYDAATGFFSLNYDGATVLSYGLMNSATLLSFARDTALTNWGLGVTKAVRCHIVYSSV